MEKYIYRYVSFATFVDMVQTQSLNFVLPTVWEDTYENSFLHSWYQSLDNDNRAIATLFENITYAQCWTLLSESDAMWRIYSYGNQSLRIKVDISDIEKLENVMYVPVTYNNNQIDYSDSNKPISHIMRRMIAQKRIPFKHEEEIRLMYIEKRSEEDILSALKTIKIISMAFDKNRTIPLPNYSVDEIERDTENFNLNGKKTCKSVSYANISDFIKGILVHPNALLWYVQTVKKYCELNNIPFEGKSELYREIE